MPLRTSRRTLLGFGFAALATRALAAPQTPRSLEFQVWRNGSQIGTHTVSFAAGADRLVASIAADMRVKLGPIPIFTYRHAATETWAGDRFVSLTSHSVSNGRVETLDARADASGVVIARSGGPSLTAPAGAAPLTHWNARALKGPLFNPQTGARLRCSVTPRGPETVRYAGGGACRATGLALAGDAQIVDWYDEALVWAALKARGPDGSTIAYRRV